MNKAVYLLPVMAEFIEELMKQYEKKMERLGIECHTGDQHETDNEVLEKSSA